MSLPPLLLPDHKTTIVATIGPASDSLKMLGHPIRVRVDPQLCLAIRGNTDGTNAGNLMTGAEGFTDGIQGEETHVTR